MTDTIARPIGQILTGKILAAVALTDIRPGDNDRTEFDPEDLWALSESIAEIGQLSPVLVRWTPGDETEYQLCAGERRWRAHQLEPCAHLDVIDAIIDYDMTDATQSSKMLAENTGRKDLRVMEESNAYRKRFDDGLTVEQIAKEAGVAKFRVQWRLDLLDLCPQAQDAVDCGLLPPACALELRRLGTDHQIAALKAWMANPTMGHIPFKRKCVEWADQANAAVQTGMFALDTDQWVDEAVAMTRKTGSAPELRKMISLLLDELTVTRQLGSFKAPDGSPAGDSPLMARARSII